MTGPTPGVVSAGDSKTAAAGVSILDLGGNAVDAVVAAAMASWVVEAPLGSAAGAGLLLHGHADRGFELVDFFTRVPGLGLPPVDTSTLHTREVIVDYGPTSQPFMIGRGTAALPAAVYGLVEAHARSGVLPLREVVQPALDYARKGFPISSHVAQIYAMLDPILSATPSVAALHRPGGNLPDSGDVLTNEGLANFFEAVAQDGMAFLMGDYLDDLLADFGPSAGGRLTRADFEHPMVSRRSPLVRTVLDHRVLTPSPPASGGTLVTLALLLAERQRLHDEEWGSPAWASKAARILKAVSVARGSGFDDRIFEPGVEAMLLDQPALDGWWDQVAKEERSIGETTHISVVDRHGAAASFTQSNGEGCGHALKRWGVHVNNFLGEEDINPAGFHALPAGSPMTTMMTPTIVLGPTGHPRLVAGSGGANRIRSAVFMAVWAVVGHGRSLFDAANGPRMHVEGEQLWFESIDVDAATIQRLQEEWPTAALFDHKSMFFGGVNLAAPGDGCGDGRRGGRHLLQS